MRKVTRLFCLAGVLAALVFGTQAALASPSPSSARPSCWLCSQQEDGSIVCIRVPCP